MAYPVIIDEAQYAPGLFRHIKIIVDKTKKKGPFFIAGSQNFNLMQNITESLAGRTGIINLCQLSANELTKAGIMPSPEEYISAGGFPVLYGDKEVVRQHWYPSYI